MFADVLSDLGPVERNEAIVAVDRLFDAFDEDGNGVVDTREFFAGVAVLCGGDGEDRTRMAFQLYDTECALLLPPLRLAAAARPPLRTYTRYVLTRGRRGSGDGFISPSEMEQYLTAVFRTMRHTSPGVFREQGCDEPTDAGPRAWRDPCPDALLPPSPPSVSPRELARATAQHCFEEADATGCVSHAPTPCRPAVPAVTRPPGGASDGRLSFDEFRAWYTKPGHSTFNVAVERNTPTELRRRSRKAFWGRSPSPRSSAAPGMQSQAQAPAAGQTARSRPLAIRALREATGLGRLTPADAFRHIRAHATSGVVTRPGLERFGAAAVTTTTLPAHALPSLQCCGGAARCCCCEGCFGAGRARVYHRRGRGHFRRTRRGE